MWFVVAIAYAFPLRRSLLRRASARTRRGADTMPPLPGSPVANALGRAIHDLFRTPGTRPSARSKNARWRASGVIGDDSASPRWTLSTEKEAGCGLCQRSAAGEEVGAKSIQVSSGTQFMAPPTLDRGMMSQMDLTAELRDYWVPSRLPLPFSSLVLGYQFPFLSARKSLTLSEVGHRGSASRRAGKQWTRCLRKRQRPTRGHGCR